VLEVVAATQDDSVADPCASCGICCHIYFVPVTARDIRRITLGLGFTPDQYLIAVPEPEPTPEGFVLQVGGPSLRLVLRKNGPMAPGQPCVFLIKGGDGTSRCGIYEHRPETCRSYPMVRRPAGVVVHPDASCPPASWPEGGQSESHWLPWIDGLQSDLAEQRGLAARWRGLLESDPATERTVEEFCWFLIEADELIEADDPS
jgi:Fe-S-cluster containining protein